MKKIIMLGILSSLCVSSLSAQSKIENAAFTKWLEEKSQKHQAIGIGYNENSVGVQYGVNTDFSFYGTDKTNLYTFLELSDNRIELIESYDLMQNYGFKGFQVMPGFGLSVDTSTAEIGVLTQLKLRYNISETIGVDFGYKYFISKPVATESKTIGVNPSTGQEIKQDVPIENDDKGFAFAYISYQF